MLIEMGVFGIDDGTDDIGRYLVVRDPLVLDFEPFAFAERICLAEEHEGRVTHRSKAIDEDYHNARGEEDSCAHGAELNEALYHGRQSMCRSGQNTLQKKRRKHA